MHGAAGAAQAVRRRHRRRRSIAARPPRSLTPTSWPPPSSSTSSATPSPPSAARSIPTTPAAADARRRRSSSPTSVPGLRELDVVVDFVLTSPLVRARETAELLAAGLEAEAGRSRRSRRSRRAAGTQAIVEAIKTHAKRHRRLALVGHEPDLGELAARLLGARGIVEFKKGAVCRIDVDGATPGGPGTLRWLLPPRVLRGARAVMRRALVVINPIAGPGRTRTHRRVRRRSRSRLSAHGVRRRRSRHRPGPHDAHDSRRDAVARRTSSWSWRGAATARSTARRGAGRHRHAAGDRARRIGQRPGARSRRCRSIPRRRSTSRRPARRAHRCRRAQRLAVLQRRRHRPRRAHCRRLAAAGRRRGLLGYVIATSASCAATSRAAYSIDDVYDVDGNALVADIIDRPRCSSRSPTRGSTATARRSRRARCSTTACSNSSSSKPQSGLQLMRRCPRSSAARCSEGPGC